MLTVNLSLGRQVLVASASSMSSKVRANGDGGDEGVMLGVLEVGMTTPSVNTDL